jgi:hypothetical protein
MRNLYVAPFESANIVGLETIEHILGNTWALKALIFLFESCTHSLLVLGDFRSVLSMVIDMSQRGLSGVCGAVWVYSDRRMLMRYRIDFVAHHYVVRVLMNCLCCRACSQYT